MSRAAGNATHRPPIKIEDYRRILEAKRAQANAMVRWEPRPGADNGKPNLGPTRQDEQAAHLYELFGADNVQEYAAAKAGRNLTSAQQQLVLHYERWQAEQPEAAAIRKRCGYGLAGSRTKPGARPDLRAE